MVSELRNGRRYVLLSSLESPRTSVSQRGGESPVDSPFPLGELLARLERQAAELGRFKALSEVAESTEQRLTAELVQTRAALKTAEERLRETEASVTRRRWWRWAS